MLDLLSCKIAHRPRPEGTAPDLDADARGRLALELQHVRETTLFAVRRAQHVRICYAAHSGKRKSANCWGKNDGCETTMVLIMFRDLQIQHSKCSKFAEFYNQGVCHKVIASDRHAHAIRDYANQGVQKPLCVSRSTTVADLPQ